MRTTRILVAFAAAVVLAASTPVHASEGVTGHVVPEVVTPGGAITIDVLACPVPATTTIEVELLPQGGAGFWNDSAAAVDGAAQFATVVPASAAAGTYVVRIWCRDLDANEVDTGEITFRVAAATTIPPTGNGNFLVLAAYVLLLGGSLTMVSSRAARR